MSSVWVAYRTTVLKVAPEMVRRATSEEAETWSALLADAEAVRTLLGSTAAQFEEVPFEEPPPFEDDIPMMQEPDMDDGEPNVDNEESNGVDGEQDGDEDAPFYDRPADFDEYQDGTATPRTAPPQEFRYEDGGS